MAVVLLISNDSVCQNVNSVSKHGTLVGLIEYRQAFKLHVYPMTTLFGL